MARSGWVSRVVVFVCVWLAGGIASVAQAGGKGRECKPGAAPSSYTLDGMVGFAEAVEYQNDSYILTADRGVHPDQVRLFSASADGVLLAKAPSSVEISSWLAHGVGVFAVGKARNPSSGDADIVLLRWGSESRPKLSTLWTGKAIDVAARAALSGTYLGAAWSATGEDGQPHVFVSTIDLDDIRIRDALDLGPTTAGTFLAIVPGVKSFSVIWQADTKLMRALVDVHGTAKGPAITLGEASGSPRGAIVCGDQVWLTHDSGSKDIAVAVTEEGAKLHDVAHIVSTPEHDRLPMSCLEQSVVIGHRTEAAKDGSIVFWVSTVDGKGNLRERRIKDIKGGEESLRDIQLAGSGDKRQAVWFEGKGPGVKIYFRDLVCD